MTGDELPAGAVARRLGVAVTTLRTWHQRYGLGPSGHSAGLHRRYTGEDIARLEMMLRLTARGVPAADAARRALATARGETGHGETGHGETGHGEIASATAGVTANPVAATGGAATGVTATDMAAAGVSVTDRAATGAARSSGGGHTIPVGRAGPAARGLARAATRLDSPMMSAAISAALASGGVVSTWDSLLRPVLAGVGTRHAQTGRFVEVEHLLSRCVSEALAAVPRPDRTVPLRVLLACAPEEQHSLPLEALAAALAERRVACRLLGARVPAPALADAVARTGPAAVVVWSHLHATADLDALRPLAGGRHRPPVVAAAGPGWDGADLPPMAERPRSLGDALTLILSSGL